MVTARSSRQKLPIAYVMPTIQRNQDRRLVCPETGCGYTSLELRLVRQHVKDCQRRKATHFFSTPLELERSPAASSLQTQKKERSRQRKNELRAARRKKKRQQQSESRLELQEAQQHLVETSQKPPSSSSGQVSVAVGLCNTNNDTTNHQWYANVGISGTRSQFGACWGKLLQG